MKKLFSIVVCLTFLVSVSAQVVSSGKVSILINNQASAEIKQTTPVVFESNMLSQPSGSSVLPRSEERRVGQEC